MKGSAPRMQHRRCWSGSFGRSPHQHFDPGTTEVNPSLRQIFPHFSHDRKRSNITLDRHFCRNANRQANSRMPYKLMNQLDPKTLTFTGLVAGEFCSSTMWSESFCGGRVQFHGNRLQDAVAFHLQFNGTARCLKIASEFRVGINRFVSEPEDDIVYFDASTIGG